MNQYPLRTRFARDIVAEILLPDREQGKVAILCPGFPSLPGKGELLRFLSGEGYVAIQMRYRGTWESSGYFLDHSPADDVRDVIHELLRTHSFTDLFSRKKISIRVSEIHLFGFSFGGPAVLLNSHIKEVKKIIAISPVLDWNRSGSDEPFHPHIQFVQEAFGEAYRVRSPKDYEKLLQTDFYDPLKQAHRIIGKKVYILHAEDDAVVPVEPLFEFAKKTGAAYSIKPHGGHTLKISHQFLWKKVKKFLSL